MRERTNLSSFVRRNLGERNRSVRAVQKPPGGLLWGGGGRLGRARVVRVHFKEGEKEGYNLGSRGRETEGDGAGERLATWRKTVRGKEQELLGSGR